MGKGDQKADRPLRSTFIVLTVSQCFQSGMSQTTGLPQDFSCQHWAQKAPAGSQFGSIEAMTQLIINKKIVTKRKLEIYCDSCQQTHKCCSCHSLLMSVYDVSVPRTFSDRFFLLFVFFLRLQQSDQYLQQICLH